VKFNCELCGEPMKMTKFIRGPNPEMNLHKGESAASYKCDCVEVTA